MDESRLKKKTIRKKKKNISTSSPIWDFVMTPPRCGGPIITLIMYFFSAWRKMMVGTKKVVEVVGGYVRSIGRTLFTRQRFISSSFFLCCNY